MRVRGDFVRFGSTFYGPLANWYNLKEKIGYVPDDESVSDSYVFLYHDDERYKMFKRELSTYQEHYREIIWVEYTKEEVENAPYYELSLAVPFQSQDRTTAPAFGVEYQYACDVCQRNSTIVKQLSPMKLDLTKINKWQMFKVPPEYIVRKDIKELIEQAGLTGVTFDPVIDYKGRDLPSNHYQMHISHVLPPMNPFTIRKDGGFAHCPECGSFILHLKNPPSYSKSDFADAADFNLMQEYIFNYNLREVIVSKRARDFLQKYVRRSGCSPVLFVEDIPQEEQELRRQYADMNV